MRIVHDQLTVQRDRGRGDRLVVVVDLRALHRLLRHRLEGGELLLIVAGARWTVQ